MNHVTLALLLVLCLSTAAFAHAMAVTAVVTPVGDSKVTIKLEDPYDVPLPVVPVRVVWSGKQGGRNLPLTEGPDGVYTTDLPVGQGDLLIETTIGGDLFKARVPAPMTAMARVPMTQYEREAQAWLPVAFFGVSLVLIGGATAYLLRKKSPALKGGSAR